MNIVVKERTGRINERAFVLCVPLCIPHIRNDESQSRKAIMHPTRVCMHAHCIYSHRTSMNQGMKEMGLFLFEFPEHILSLKNLLQLFLERTGKIKWQRFLYALNPAEFNDLFFQQRFLSVPHTCLK